MIGDVLKRWILKNAQPGCFAYLISIRGKLRGTNISCSYLKDVDLYRVYSENWSRLASTKSRVLLYLDGVESRSNSLFRSYLLENIDFPSECVVIDCGANIGDFYFALENNIFSNYKYFAFEPSPSDFLCLKTNLSETRNITHLNRRALWNKQEEINFFVHVATASSSIIEPKFYESEISVEAVRLDEEIDMDVFLLKVEAEGAEPEVIEGASKLLSRVKYVTVDVGPERGKNEEETRDEVVALMERNGFKIVRENSKGRKVVLFSNSNL